MKSNDEKTLVKILAEFQNDDGSSSMEGLRAVSLGGGLYEIQVIPIMAEGYHFLDIVRCREYPNEDHCPVVIELVLTSGQQTVGIIFNENIDDEQQVDLLWALNQHVTTSFNFLRVSKTHCAISFHSNDHEDIPKLLDSYAEQGKIASYEILE